MLAGPSGESPSRITRTAPVACRPHSTANTLVPPAVRANSRWPLGAIAKSTICPTSPGSDRCETSLGTGPSAAQPGRHSITSQVETATSVIPPRHRAFATNGPEEGGFGLALSHTMGSLPGIDGIDVLQAEANRIESFQQATATECVDFKRP